MIKLTYTEEMQKQDNLWDENRENLVDMEKLLNLIMQEAIKKGYKGKYQVFAVDNIEVICEIYEREDDRHDNYVMGKDCRFSNCKQLIKQLEEILN
ncbi:hypothetical protein [Anaerovorax sp. IOR16]|uniref:hypothetical protein n=1 Tax=Anaerovorax sp. IOR16 TaxID=2773458 RepID=UPI0019D2C0E5|nr:hypothetical protein [Anaerovorax sp. IOR16]